MVAESGIKDNCRLVAGVWERMWEEEPLGDSEGADRDTFVLWTQTPCGLFVDIRLPKASPGLSLEAADEAGYAPNPKSINADGFGASIIASQGHFDVFMKQKSFAGRRLQISPGDTKTSGDALAKDKILHSLASGPDVAIPLCTCFWKRDIDYQPPSGGLDVGVCVSSSPLESDGKIELRETGDDASYAEGWRRLAGTSEGPFAALELLDENDEPRKGYWAVAGNRFAYAVGRPDEFPAADGMNPDTAIQKCVGMSLRIALDSVLGSDGINTNKISLAWNYIGVAGTITENSQWIIGHSINPNLVGCELVQSKNGEKNACSYLRRTADQNVIEQVLIQRKNSIEKVRRWKIIEMSDGFEMPLRSS
eukprot:CAMPEP_0183767928 /NCGR_PEP_ID=MMETSP0739-20130205/12471_1 /TAXON_ID=385413 /ORGANISM="Thalassiosira miniscula, Strain CCMP1093" /LENGTH=364 /DNA_ID=CAMNT_0026006873 /DNA_START=81 /DNA_END=1175 /DNA_ORIENTATION=+